MSTLHDTADAVKELLADASLSKSFEARLVYDTELALEDLDTLYVDVVAAGLSCLADSRVSLAYDVQIDIAVRYRFGTPEQESATGAIDVEDVKPYLDLLEEIGEELARPANRAPSDKTAAAWVGNDIRFPWVPEHLRTMRQYTGILRATYRVAKDL